MTHLVINRQPTRDPNTLRFVTNRTLNSSAPKAYYEPGQAADDPVAAELFAIHGVIGLFIINEFCTVHKTAQPSWDELAPQIERVMRQHWPQMG